MNIYTDNYQFPVHIEAATSDDPITNIYIGNPRNRPKPCIDITVIDDEAILQEVQYMSTCSTNKFLQKGHGTVEMIQGSLKWFMMKYPHISKVSLTDKSYIPVSDGYSLALPEYYMLVHGKTWYEHYFGAVLSSSSPKASHTAIQSYRTLRNKFVHETPLLSFVSAKDRSRKVYEVISEIFKKHVKNDQETYEFIRLLLRQLPLTGMSWEISRSTILGYPVNVSEKGSQKGLGKSFHKLTYRVPYYHMAAMLRLSKNM